MPDHNNHLSKRVELKISEIRIQGLFNIFFVFLNSTNNNNEHQTSKIVCANGFYSTLWSLMKT